MLKSANSYLSTSMNFLRISCCLSYVSNSSLYFCEQFLPIGDTLIIPVRYSMKVPRLIGISISERYFKQKLINFFSFSSERYSLMDSIKKDVLDIQSVRCPCKRSGHFTKRNNCWEKLFTRQFAQGFSFYHCLRPGQCQRMLSNFWDTQSSASKWAE